MLCANPPHCTSCSTGASRVSASPLWYENLNAQHWNRLSHACVDGQVLPEVSQCLVELRVTCLAGSRPVSSCWLCQHQYLWIRAAPVPTLGKGDPS